MKISFDFGLTLENHPDLLTFAFMMQSEGHEIYLLSGIADKKDKLRRVKFLEKYCLNMNDIFYTKPDEKGGAEEKALVCQREKIDLHFDNSPGVAKAIRNKTCGETMVIVVNPKH